MKTLTVTLKQHTPLIHFQPGQYGATLRASEVKPKLDRFILGKLGKEEFEEAKRKKWLIGKGDHPALNYKMRIIGKDVILSPIEGYWGYRRNRNGQEIPIASPMFFGNMQNEKDKSKKNIKKCFSKCNDITLTLYSLSDDVIKVVLKYLQSFFLQTNFGTRQSKGYGSFSLVVDEKWKNAVEEVKVKEETMPVYPYFTCKGGEKVLFNEMEWFHKAIRSGINDCFGERFYMKSLMFAYAKEKGKQWEKKTIKTVFYDQLSDAYNSEDINEKELANHNNKSDVLTYTSQNEGEFLFKDCLGLSTIERWKKPVISGGRLMYKDFFTLKKGFRKTAEQSDEIQRMKSPVLLKPIKENGFYKIYIMYNDVPEKFLKSKFNISVDCCAENDFLPLKIYPEFSMEDYFDFIFRQYSDRKFVYYRVDIPKMILVGRNTAKSKRIQEIFKEIRDNYKKSVYAL